MIWLKNAERQCGHSLPMYLDVLNKVPHKTRPDAPGAVVFRRGVKPSGVMFLNAGCVALGVLEAGELSHHLGDVQGPIWLDASAVVLHQQHVVDAVAQTEATVHVIPLTAFKIMMSEMPALLASVLHDVAKAHRMQSELAVSRLVKDADARCAEWLLRQAGPHTQDGMAVTLAQRKRLIAAQLGIAPETFSRVLRHLRDRHLISGTGRSLRLIDPAGLKQLAGP